MVLFLTKLNLSKNSSGIYILDVLKSLLWLGIRNLDIQTAKNEVVSIFL